MPFGYVLGGRDTKRQLFWPSDDKFNNIRGDKKRTRAVYDDLTSRCRMAQADTALLWFTFACTVGAVALSFLSKRSGRGGSIV